MFAHEKLQVYAKALNFNAALGGFITRWDKRHAFVDHLSRAAESILLNLAEAAWQHNGPGRLQVLDYSVGSSLECAGCLDIALIKGLLSERECTDQKQPLCEVTKMLVGLRNAWETLRAKEEPVPYQSRSKAEQEPMFHHESLDMYQIALEFVRWIDSKPQARELKSKVFRQMDEAGTSVILNIAEGNGRYAALDQHRFLEIAQRAAIKAAVCLDMGLKDGEIAAKDAVVGKDLLRRVSAMIAKF
jgi:four helix bundle protein